jgi:hypothetical protein
MLRANPALLAVCIAFLLPVIWTSSSHADDALDCFSGRSDNWQVQEACYRDTYRQCLRRKELGTPLDLNCEALLDNPPLSKGECTHDDRLNNRPGCVAPKARD